MHDSYLHILSQYSVLLTFEPIILVFNSLRNYTFSAPGDWTKTLVQILSETPVKHGENMHHNPVDLNHMSPLPTCENSELRLITCLTNTILNNSLANSVRTRLTTIIFWYMTTYMHTVTIKQSIVRKISVYCHLWINTTTKGPIQSLYLPGTNRKGVFRSVSSNTGEVSRATESSNRIVKAYLYFLGSCLWSTNFALSCKWKRGQNVSESVALLTPRGERSKMQ